MNTLAIEKEVQARLRILFKDEMCSRLLAVYGYDIFHRTSLIQSGFIEFFRDFYKDRAKDQICVEVGSWNGLTSYFLSFFFKKVISCDIVNNPVKYEICQDRRNIEFIKVKDEYDKMKKMMKYDYQFAYLDGNHRKTEVDWAIGQKAGAFFVHEAWEDAPENWAMVNGSPMAFLIGFNFAYIGPFLDEWKERKECKERLQLLEKSGGE